MDKERDILQMYRERQDEFRLPLREGGWEMLEKELAPRPAVVRRPDYRWWAAAAVILLCIALSIPMFLPKEAAVLVSDSQSAEPVKVMEPKENPVRETPSALPQPSDNPVRKHPVHKIASVSVISQSGVIARAGSVLSEADLENEVKALSMDKPVEIQNPKRTDVGPQPERKTTLSDDVVNRNKQDRKKKSEGWSVGVSGGSGKTVSGLNMFTNNEVMDSNQGTQPPFENPEDPDKKPDDPEAEPPVVPFSAKASQGLPQLRSASYEYVHRMPLSIGLSVRKSFTDDFGLESGLSYTFLYSDIKQSGTRGYIGDQRIHYLGVPLRANWTVYRRGVFSMYLSGGLMAEYCVSAKRRIIHEITTPEMNRWQFSVNASVGAEVKLLRPLSLYLEPGVGYYFDNGNDIPTIRNERPWMFGLQLGLRFSY